MRFEFVLLPDSRHSAGMNSLLLGPVFAWSNVFALQAWSEEWLRQFAELNPACTLRPRPASTSHRQVNPALNKALSPEPTGVPVEVQLHGNRLIGLSAGALQNDLAALGYLLRRTVSAHPLFQ